MKPHYLITLFFSLVLCINSFTQEEKETKYIFSGNKKIKISGFITPIMEFSAIENNFAFFMGGGGGLIFNQKFYFGGYGEGLTTNHDKELTVLPIGTKINMKTTFGHGGFLLGYLFLSNKPIHFGISSRIGWGTINSINDINKYHDLDCKDNVFVIIPQVEVEFNFTKWFKVNIGAGYRVVTGVERKENTVFSTIPQCIWPYRQKDFNKPQGTIALCFGYFK